MTQPTSAADAARLREIADSIGLNNTYYQFESQADADRAFVRRIADQIVTPTTPGPASVEATLLPCPFCYDCSNVAAFSELDGERRWRVRCLLCGAGTRAHHKREAAEADWNRRRAPSPPPAGEPQAGGALLGIPDAEVKAAWEKFCKEHIQPSDLFRIAQGMVRKTDEQDRHLTECARCRKWLEAYSLPTSDAQAIPEYVPMEGFAP